MTERVTEPEFDKGELNQLLIRAHDEITNLRKRNNEIEPKAHAYDTLAVFARLSEPETLQGYAEDIAWRLRQYRDRLLDRGEKSDSNSL